MTSVAGRLLEDFMVGKESKEKKILTQYQVGAKGYKVSPDFKPPEAIEASLKRIKSVRYMSEVFLESIGD